MNFTNLGDIDALRAAVTAYNFMDYYNSAIPALAPYAPALVIAAVFLVLYRISGYLAFALRPFAMLTTWQQRKFGERLMTKTRREEIDDDIQEHLIDFFQDKLDTGKWTREETRDQYARFSKFFPAFRRAIDPPPSLKQRLSEWVLNRKRPPVEAVPLPQEKAIAAIHIRRRK